MSDDKQPVNEWAFLGRGIARTFMRDVKAIALGIFIGVLIGVVGAYLLGLSFQFGLKFGALIGAFLALAARSSLSMLFEYDRSPQDKDPGP